MIFDTSVWIDHLNNRPTPQALHLAESLPSRIHSTPTILQEVLQGISNVIYFDVIRLLLTQQEILRWDAIEAAIAAAQLYSDLRRKGITIRKPNDCLIAAYALHFNLELCHSDSDFDRIAIHASLKIWIS
ncbi:MAG: PIN domain-containing protein [Cytophagaceae bacterium]|nr:PIN domain-containing protein [Cytophagaceae bacterium]